MTKLSKFSFSFLQKKKERKKKKNKGDYKNRKRSNVDESYGRDNG